MDTNNTPAPDDEPVVEYMDEGLSKLSLNALIDLSVDLATGRALMPLASRIALMHYTEERYKEARALETILIASASA